MGGFDEGGYLWMVCWMVLLIEENFNDYKKVEKKVFELFVEMKVVMFKKVDIEFVLFVVIFELYKGMVLVVIVVFII